VSDMRRVEVSNKASKVDGILKTDAKSVRNMYSYIAVTNKHTAKLHHVT